jgi:hypothetical protein
VEAAEPAISDRNCVRLLARCGQTCSDSIKLSLARTICVFPCSSSSKSVEGMGPGNSPAHARPCSRDFPLISISLCCEHHSHQVATADRKSDIKNTQKLNFEGKIKVSASPTCAISWGSGWGIEFSQPTGTRQLPSHRIQNPNAVLETKKGRLAPCAHFCRLVGIPSLSCHIASTIFSKNATRLTTHTHTCTQLHTHTHTHTHTP